MAIEIVDFPIKNGWIFPWQNVSSPEGIVESLNIGQTDAINGGLASHVWVLEDKQMVTHICKTIVTAEANNYRTIYAIVTYIRQI